MKIKIEVIDGDVSLRVTPEFLRKYLISVEGNAYLDYQDGEDPTQIYGTYEMVMRAIERAEKDG